MDTMTIPRLFSLVALTTSMASVVGCASAPHRAAELKPLEERRARAIIEKAILDSGSKPQQPRVVKVNARELTMDMAIAGGPYGVAYITRAEAKQLGDVLPRRDPDSDQLRLVRGEDGAVVLIVWEVDYRFDFSSSHSATAVAAEGKLKRDVADFVQHVVKPGKGR